LLIQNQFNNSVVSLSQARQHVWENLDLPSSHQFWADILTPFQSLNFVIFTALTNLDSQSTNSNDGDQTPTTPSGSQGMITTEEIITGTPSNLLVTFLEYCSIAMQVSLIKVSRSFKKYLVI
jgi:hypothetical protein